MILVSIDGEKSICQGAKALLSSANVEFEINEESGLDGAQVLELTLRYGPSTLLLLKSLLELIEEAVKLKRLCRIVIENRQSNEPK